MKFKIVFCLLVFISSSLISQNKISENLLNKISKGDNQEKYFNYYVKISNSLDLDSLRNEFNIRNSKASERAKITNLKLREIAEKSQKSVIEFCKSSQRSFENEIEYFQAYWIANILVIKSKPSIIFQIEKFNEVEIIFEDNGKLQNFEPVESKTSTSNSQRNSEEGLKVINAHKMWARGYTGRSRIGMGVDTGVNFKHPSIKRNFLGNHFPWKQSWMGYNHPFPFDISPSSHGTHTTGTTMGLDRNTNDTIGVAFNAYWIHADPIVSILADVRPLEVILMSFQWAVDPDDNPQTSYDIPDVINNSWGYYVDNPPELSQCNSTESMIIDAAFIAGIAIVFSAGNTGPDPGSLHEPALVAKSLVNTFTVGSLNGNHPQLPISDFSSRGPTICADTGSLAIKPEVSAPGQNVRSAQGTDGYGELSGTSMAAPHVTGAVLLLKEAFPYLSGEEILLALYNTARDLGDVGEDNTFGMGVINVDSAFQLLSNSHTPTNISGNDFDVAITGIIFPEHSFTFSNTIAPKIVFKNNGNNAVTAQDFALLNNGVSTGLYSWSGNLATNESDTIQLPEITLSAGYNEIIISAVSKIQNNERDTLNNNLFFGIKMLDKVQLPYFEDFEDEAIQYPESEWAVENPEWDMTWETDSCTGIPGSYVSANLNFYNYYPDNGQHDELISPLIEMPDTGDVFFTFSYSNQKRVSFIKDTLAVILSTDLGNSFEDTIFLKGGTDLSTVEGTGGQRFIPSDMEHWKTDTFILTEYIENEFVVIKFLGINDNGNDIWIDNINISQDLNSAISIVENKNRVLVYPNPAKDEIFIKWDLVTNSNEKNIRIFSSDSRLLYSFNTKLEKGSQSIPLNELSPGIYFIHFSSGAFFKSERFIKL